MESEKQSKFKEVSLEEKFELSKEIGKKMASLISKHLVNIEETMLYINSINDIKNHVYLLKSLLALKQSLNFIPIFDGILYTEPNTLRKPETEEEIFLFKFYKSIASCLFEIRSKIKSFIMELSNTKSIQRIVELLKNIEPALTLVNESTLIQNSALSQKFSDITLDSKSQDINNNLEKSNNDMSIDLEEKK